MSEKNPLVQFNPKLPKLTSNEQQVLQLLIEAAKLIVPIYKLQENYKYPGANYYPHDVTKAEMEKAAESQPRLFSPYTVVEKIDGELVAVPYHEKYADLLKPVADKLMEASKLTSNKEFSERLKIQAQSLLYGSYDKAMVYMLGKKPYILDIQIGPIERYNDKLFFVKTAYQAWVGVLDPKQTAQVVEYKNAILSARRKSLIPSEKLDYYDKVQVKIEDIILFSGFISRVKFAGVNLPNDLNLLEKHGSDITLFKQSNEYRLKKEILPAFKTVFSPRFQKQYSLSDLISASMALVSLHQLSHAYLRYRNAENNLQDLFPIIDELAAYVTGMKVSGSLLLKDIINQKRLSAMMVVLLARCFYLALYEKDDESKKPYTIGGAILINYLLENGAIQELEGLSVPNFVKMFVSIDELESITNRLLSSGTRHDAEVFIKKYGDLEKLQKFR